MLIQSEIEPSGRRSISDLGKMEGNTQPARRLTLAAPAGSVQAKKTVFRGAGLTKLWPLRRPGRLLEGARGPSRSAPRLPCLGLAGAPLSAAATTGHSRAV